MQIFQQQVFTLVLIFLLTPLCCSTANAEFNELLYWKNLKKSADKCFAGIDFDIKFEIGSIEKNLLDDSETNQYGKLIFSVPLLSKDSKIKRSAEKIKFLESGSDLISEIEKAKKLITQKIKYLALLKKIDGEEGLEILEKIITIQTEIIELETNSNSAIRKLEGYFKCSEKLE
jgi:hypothetical protein